MVAREAIDVGASGDLLERIQEFERFLRREERSPATVRSYRWGLDDLRDFLLSRGVDSLAGITRPLLEAWQDRLLAAHMKPRSRSLASTSARMFLRWAADHEYCDPRLKDWLTSVRVKPLKPKPLPPADLERLRDYFEDRPSELVALRNRALFMVYLTTGLRVSEGLQLPRVGYERTEVRQKGGREKLVTMPTYTQSVVREYVSRRIDNSPRLFVNHPSGTPMTSAGVRAVWRQVTQQLGIAPFTTHQLRHTFATQLLAQGIDIRVVAELMGHSGMQSIMGYTEVLEAARQQAMRAMEDVVRGPEQVIAPDPRTLTQKTLAKTKRRGRPRFRILP